MKKSINTMLAGVLLVCTLVPSINVNAAEAQEFETIQEAVEESKDITRSDVAELKEASEIVTLTQAEEDVNGENLVKEMYTYETVVSMADFAGLGYSNGTKGPISIVKATLNPGHHDEKEVYIVGLSGTAFVQNQATGIVSDLLAGFNLTNPYFSAVKSTLLENYPQGANLILCGHSLGGMVAQEIAADPAIKKNFNVLNTVTFGAPLINGLSREGNIQRLGDKNDIIPYMSVTGMILPVRAIGGLNREDGGYKSVKNFWEAHMNSYARKDVWGNYDVLGFKYGQNKLQYNVMEVKYYKAPTKW